MEESPGEEKKLNDIIPSDTDTTHFVCDGDNDPKVEDITTTTPFSQTEDDEAFARMLQKEEEELAAAAGNIEYEFTIVSPKGRRQTEVDDVWEEVKKRRNKQQTTVTTTTNVVEEQ